MRIKEAFDHLLLGAPTLESGIRWLEERTGVRAAMGGSHPGLGTWNALASLGPAQYVEIIAPDPAQPGVETAYVAGLRDYPEPRIATWAARGVDLAGHFLGSLPDDVSCEPARQGARVRPDGTRLAWTLAFPKHREHARFGGALPFFIEWGSFEHHPGSSAPPGLGLRSLTFRHPEPEALKWALAGLGIDGEAEGGTRPAICVRLETPRGLVSIE